MESSAPMGLSWVMPVWLPDRTPSALYTPPSRSAFSLVACSPPRPPEYSMLILGNALLKPSLMAWRIKSPGGPQTTTLPSFFAAPKTLSHFSYQYGLLCAKDDTDATQTQHKAERKR